MSQQIQNSNPTSYSSSIENIFNQAVTEIENIQHSSKSEIPNIQEKNSHSTTSELPVLPRPSASALSLDSLVNSIGFEQRHINCRQGIARLEAKSAEQKEINQKELETLKEQVEKLNSQKILNAFKKAFTILGSIIGIASSAISMALGVITANPILIAGASIGVIMSVDSLCSSASDGKISIMNGITEGLKAAGVDEKTSQIIATVIFMAITLVNVGLSFGASATKAKDIAETISKTASLATITQKALTIGNGVITSGQGATTIASSVQEYQTTQLKITQKELQAILEKIKQAIDTEKALIEAEVEKSNALLTNVKNIIENANKTNQTILTHTPNFA